MALPPPYKWNKAPSCCSFLLFPSLAVNDGLVDTRLSLQFESRNIFVSEAEISLACPSMSVREEVTQQIKGVARPSYASERRSHGDGDGQFQPRSRTFQKSSKEVQQKNGGEPVACVAHCVVGPRTNLPHWNPRATQRATSVDVHSQHTQPPQPCFATKRGISDSRNDLTIAIACPPERGRG